ncbi:membrane dipeptidase, partial [Tremellales sp. Uapishka_1]
MRALALVCMLLVTAAVAIRAQHSSHDAAYATAVKLLEKCVAERYEADHSRYQLIDTHVDTPQVMRVLSRHPHDQIESLSKGYPGHFDLPRARKGGLGGVFFTVWTPCTEQLGIDLGPDFLNSDNTLSLALTAADATAAFEEGKIATFLGMEGSHMLGNSLATMRMYAKLGVKYLTLTHVCHSAFASSAGGGAGTDGSALGPVHPNNGLTPFGAVLIRELNRLGEVMHDVLDVTTAPVLFSHSGARGIYNHNRNVPDSVLDRIGSGPGQNPGVIHSVLFDVFIDPANATIARVVDHVEYIADRCGKAHVGLGSDFDGMPSTVEGVEDVSSWPSIIAEFVRRGWTENEIAGLLSGNLLRVMRETENIAHLSKATLPAQEVYDKRSDLPGLNWGGPQGAYLPPKVRVAVHPPTHDEL